MSDDVRPEDQTSPYPRLAPAGGSDPPHDPLDPTPSSLAQGQGIQPPPGRYLPRPAGAPPPPPRRGSQGWMVAFLVLVMLIAAAVLVWLFAFRGDGGGGAPGKLTVAPAVLDFGDQQLGQRSATQFVTLRNDGDEPVDLLSIELSGESPGDFQVTDDTGCLVDVAIAPGDACDVGVRFKPKKRADRVATLVVGTGPGELRVELRGTGIGDAFVQLESTKLDFGAVLIGKTRTLKTSLTNTGNAPLTIETVAIDGDPGYRLASGSTCRNGTKVKVGETCILAVAFRPTQAGKASATLTLVTDAKGGPGEVVLRGEGKGEARLAADETRLDFGEVLIGDTSEPLTVTISNSGTGPTTLTGIALAGPDLDAFDITGGTCTDGAQLDPGESCEVDIIYRPNAEAEQSATLVVSGVEVALAGTGFPRG